MPETALIAITYDFVVFVEIITTPESVRYILGGIEGIIVSEFSFLSFCEERLNFT